MRIQEWIFLFIVASCGIALANFLVTNVLPHAGGDVTRINFFIMITTSF